MAASNAFVEQWDLFEVSLSGPSVGNPFLDVELSARFTNGDESIAADGFYDGEGIYRIRFMPPKQGEWRYETSSNQAQLSGKAGSFTCIAPSPGNQGPVRVSNTFHFAYADGTPYRQIGTTCYAWSHQSCELQEQTLSTLKASPFNKLRMCIFPKWYAYNRGEPPLYPFEGTPPNRWDFARFNPAFFRHQEKRICQLLHLGIEADLILFHPYDEGHWGFDRMDASSDDRYLRYVVARLAAYRNVWWSMANEFDFMKEKKPADWDRYFQIVEARDPNHHLRSIHNARLIYDNNRPWVTHASIQNGSAVEDFGRAALYRDVYRKPIVFDEVKYEGDLPERWGDLSAEEMVHRFWQGTISGTYVGHGETYKHPQNIIWWACGGKLRGNSPARLAFLKKILDDAPAKGLEPIDKWQDVRTCGQPGEYYLVYLGKEHPTEWLFELPRAELSAGMHFQIDVLDTWGMTITPVDGVFTIVVDSTYRYHAEGLPKVKLPGKPYMAIRIRRVKGDSVKHEEGARIYGEKAAMLVWAMLAFAPVGHAKVVIDTHASPRIQYGASKLEEAIKAAAIHDDRMVIVGNLQDESIKQLFDAGRMKPLDRPPGHEGFVLAPCAENALAVIGGDDSGTLYGCMELASRIRQSRKLPAALDFTDAPAMTLRGACIGMQKTYILPGRHVYEYPFTPELFPFFYDKAFWQKYLDVLAANRMNALYLWSGHPFASLVKLADYPYAMEVPQDVFEKNVAMYRYIVTEADKRGIRIVQMFYNILLSKPFAEKNGLETQLAAPVPIAADYTRKSVAEFVRQYPNVGIMVCLGEALQGQENQTKWLTEVILPGVKDGMKAAGLTEEIPVIVRTHTTDLRQTMPEALKIYKNLFTEAKFNGESLTTWEPRGTRQEVHQAMSRLGTTHVINVHILANLEPFRYGAQKFIQKCVQAGRDRLGARGLHLYPLFYWNWPDSPDMTDPPLKQWERDWIWFEAWGRYSWNPDIPEVEDHTYWVERLTDKYGSVDAAAKILDAYNDSGECAPRILRRFGITEGNRQTMSLGMTLDELVDPDRYHAFPELWESQSPPGERLQKYVRNECTHQPHEGETPPQIIREVLDFSAKAVAEIDAAAPHVTKDRDEFTRLQNDVYCIRAMSLNYAAKANAAICVLRYGYTKDIADMERAQTFLAESLDHYRELTKLTEHTYRFANSMQTRQRRIPVTGGVDGKPANFHWSHLLPQYEKELQDFQSNVSALKEEPAQ